MKSNASDLKFPAIVPKPDSDRVEVLLEEAIGCRWSMSVLRVVAGGVCRPGAIEREITGISTKVLNDRLRRFKDAGIFERRQFPEIPPRVEYRLTPYGKNFTKLLKEIEKLQALLDKETKSKKLPP
jgi:DNA-binding HxlR family transcriptional regulator